MENAPLGAIDPQPTDQQPPHRDRASAARPNLGQPSLYERDFYQWAQQTTAALKAKAFDQVDWENVIEEIESMGRSERRELQSRLIVLLEHLLKLHYWTVERANNERGWRNTIIEQRRQIQLVLADSPSLRGMVQDRYADAYRQAREDVILKTQLPETTIPQEPPFGVTEALTANYLLE